MSVEIKAGMQPSYPKLIREKDKHITEDSVVRDAGDAEYLLALRNGLRTGVDSLFKAETTRSDFINNAANIMDILQTMMDMSSGVKLITAEDVEVKRKDLRESKGKFSRRRVLVEKDNS